jgi:hypothetical protein
MPQRLEVLILPQFRFTRIAPTIVSASANDPKRLR